jgi:putative membrane protein
MKHYIAVIVAFFVFLFTISSHANGTPGERAWSWHHMRGGGTFMGVFWIILIGVVVYFFVNHFKQQQSDNRETPLDILNKRYAQGELSKEEYEQMKRDLAP